VNFLCNFDRWTATYLTVFWIFVCTVKSGVPLSPLIQERNFLNGNQNWQKKEILKGLDFIEFSRNAFGTFVVQSLFKPECSGRILSNEACVTLRVLATILLCIGYPLQSAPARRSTVCSVALSVMVIFNPVPFLRDKRYPIFSAANF